MLSYRHGFHAGNHADVLKHAAYVFLAAYLQRKNGGVLFLDTHAGAGRYDLASDHARKTGEHRDGVARVLAAPEPPRALARYLDLVRAGTPDGLSGVYPGSPALAASLARPQDRVVLFDLHPTDHGVLAQEMQGCQRVHVQRTDGLAALKAHLPPPERRALVLIDPSYEIKTDYALAPRALAAAWRKFPTGVYALWYPVIERERAEAVAESLLRDGVRRVHRVELCVRPDAPGRGMTGSGLLIVNAPYTTGDFAAEALPWIAAALNAQGPIRNETLAGE